MPTRLRSRSLEPIPQNAPLLVLPGDLIGKILGTLLPTGDNPAAEHVKEGLKLAYAVCCTCKSLCKSVNGTDMEPYWEALCKAMGPFVQQPFAHVKLLWPNVDDPNNAHDPCTGYGLRRVNNTRLPWKRTVGLALTLLARTPFQMRKPFHLSEVNQDLLSVYMLLHRAVAHVRTIGWSDGKQLILSVLGYCLFRANAVKFARVRRTPRAALGEWYEKEVKPVLVLRQNLAQTLGICGLRIRSLDQRSVNVPAGRFGQLLPQRHRDKATEQDQDGLHLLLVPVSYTHLTLPTKA